MKAIVTLIRWALTLALLVVVWKHSHWSVALTLFFCVFAIEGLSFQMAGKR